MPLDQQADAWNALDKQIATKYFRCSRPTTPASRRPRIEDQGDFDDNTIGMPTWKNIWDLQ
jgi:hypothetical protein